MMKLPLDIPGLGKGMPSKEVLYMEYSFCRMGGWSAWKAISGAVSNWLKASCRHMKPCITQPHSDISICCAPTAVSTIYTDTNT